MGENTLQLVTAASRSGALGPVLDATLPVQLPAPWEGSRSWLTCLGPCTHMGDAGGVPGCCLQPGLALAIVAICGGNQRMEDLSVTLSEVPVFDLNFAAFSVRT